LPNAAAKIALRELCPAGVFDFKLVSCGIGGCNPPHDEVEQQASARGRYQIQKLEEQHKVSLAVSFNNDSSDQVKQGT
jgi:hypothetical protein